MRARRPPDLSSALLVFGGVVFLLMSASSRFAGLGVWSTAAMEWALIGAPMGLALAVWGPAGLGLRAPGGRGLVASTLIGAFLWIVLAQVILPIQDRIAPTPAELLRQLKSVAAPDEGPLVALVSAALSPAICEELLCRGLLLPALRRHVGAVAAVIISATMFALLHGSVYRFAPTFVLGLSLGTVAVAAGTWAAMIVHFLNNAAVILISTDAGMADFVDEHTYLLVVVAGIAVAVGHVMLLPKKTTG